VLRRPAQTRRIQHSTRGWLCKDEDPVWCMRQE
jgi:hypothetical protein